MYEHLALSDNGFLFDTRSGATYSLSRTGTFLLRELMRGTHPSDLAARLTDAFEVDLPAAARDCEQFLFRVKDLALLDEASDDDDDDPGSPRAAEPFGGVR
ncbi:MAG: PqqD family protein [Deltaproteobacteria bacterium]|nr:PqqD family protein [Deltaproteobacteria bacterium]MCB9789146.1 PqqD family protein [Deltaproteobacteria bacterium]